MLLETKKISKKFGSFYALSDVDISIREGEVLGLVGENGAGKSTLIKILSGVYRQTSGDIFLSGRKAAFNSPEESRKNGISVIHQDRNLVPYFSGIENLYLGRPVPRHFLSVDFKAMKNAAKSVMEEYGISIPLDKLSRDMSPSERTMLEILRAVMDESRLIIMDEPTASLTDKESNKLFSLIEKINSTGVSVLYVSHRLEEVISISDEITVLRNGRVVDTVSSASTDVKSLVSLMSGNFAVASSQRVGEYGDVIYSVSHIKTADGAVKDASFSVHSGEIMGLFGLDGSGRTETLEALFGIRRICSGKIEFMGKEVRKPSPSHCLENGIALIHEGRRTHALVPTRSVKDNIVLSVVDSYAEHGFYRKKEERKDAETKIHELDIQARSMDQCISELSGGNQQKVVFARALMSKPKVLLCDEPTQAVDVRTRSEIHALLRKLASSGCAIVLVTSDLKEMLETADSITIIQDGRTYEHFDSSELTSERILSYCYEKR